MILSSYPVQKIKKREKKNVPEFFVLSNNRIFTPNDVLLGIRTWADHW